MGRVEEHERVFQGARGHVKKSLEVIECGSVKEHQKAKVRWVALESFGEHERVF